MKADSLKNRVPGLYFLEAFIFLTVIFVSYHFMGVAKVLHWKLSMRDFTLGTVTLALTQRAVKKPLHAKHWILPLAAFLIEALIYPYILCRAAGNVLLNFNLVNPYFLTGISAAIVISIVTRYASFTKGKKLFGMAVLLLILYIVLAAAVYIVYFSMYHSGFVLEDMIPVVMTQWTEARAFLVEQVGIRRLAEAMTGFLFLAGGFAFLIRKTIKDSSKDPAPGFQCYRLLSLFLLVLGLFTMSHWILHCFPAYEYRLAREYISDVEKSKASRVANRNNFQITGNEPVLSEKLPGTVILIIGESENRDEMKAFNPKVPVDTTPWLTGEKDSSNFFLFPKAYSCFSATAEVLPMYLTSMNQYNKQPFKHSVSILDAAEKAGYDTWWISNHDQMGNRNAAFGIIASEANHDYWESPSRGDDMKLLDFLKQVPKEGNNFVVIHIMGCHARYIDRYPGNMETLSIPGYTDQHNEYDTATLYMDKVMENIFNYAKDNMNLRAMIFCSDHGEDMKRGHSAGGFTFPMSHVPLFIYLSPEYENTYPMEADILKSHEKDYFTNDLMFDTICGILRVPNNYYDSTYDLLSRDYSLPLEKAVTMHGKVPLAEDTEK